MIKQFIADGTIIVAAVLPEVDPSQGWVIHSVHRNNRASGLPLPLPSTLGRAEQDGKVIDTVNNMPDGTDLIIIIRFAVGLTSHMPSVKGWVIELSAEIAPFVVVERAHAESKRSQACAGRRHQ